MRYSLPASAGLIAVAAAFAIFSPADAADCGCRDAVRAALAKDRTVEHAAARRAAEPFYDYRAARAVDGPGYGSQWREAPQGYVAPVPAYDGPADLPPYAAAPEELHGRYDYVILSWWSDKQRNQELKELNTITSQRAELEALSTVATAVHAQASALVYADLFILSFCFAITGIALVAGLGAMPFGPLHPDFRRRSPAAPPQAVQAAR